MPLCNGKAATYASRYGNSLRFSFAIQNIASDCGCYAVVHSGVDPALGKCSKSVSRLPLKQVCVAHASEMLDVRSRGPGTEHKNPSSPEMQKKKGTGLVQKEKRDRVGPLPK